ncbi:E3 ubiquitin-protein ligase RNF169 [Osmerus eperlanus]|uniref:E3 ubiquitin-protein ligase RNF169 n=1 Tax=Osmerus eperlanus TaxID=29151 RepID=UPI002E157F44
MKMATTGSAKCTGSIGKDSHTRSADVRKSHTPSQLLTLEEARCPICSEILFEPVTMPCSHSVCLHCFKRTVELTSLCCPLCRLRVSSWARKQSREKNLVNTELWDIVRRSYPERCKSRMEQRACETHREEMFCPPGQIPRSGDFRPEHDKQKVTMNEDKKDMGRKILSRREECGTIKQLEDPLSGVLSDSENEEPIGKRTRNVSAFVKRTKLSPACAKDWLPKHFVQRSQSCTASVEGRGKVKTVNHSLLDKVSIAHSYNAGILLSSENSRSFSAPIIVPEKRYSWRSVTATSALLIGPQSKQERSISPESNDSISEELNHFKPIVCSPCTPPKRLPDGRVIEPTIVKSTPRNLTHSFQRLTSYEASTFILQKWKQIEVDRQCIEMTSKGTLTSPFNEEIIIKQSPTDEREIKPFTCASTKVKEDLGVCRIRTNTCNEENEKVCLLNKRRLIFDQPVGDTTLNQRQAIRFNLPSLLHTGEGPARECGFSRKKLAPESSCGPSPVRKKHPFAPLDRVTGDPHCKLKLNTSVDQRKEIEKMNCAQNQTTSRRSRKRSQKTKHLEETELQIKRFKTQCRDSLEMEKGQSDFSFQRVKQEAEDRRLALKLQKQFDRDQQRLNKNKKSPDKYFLRSWFRQDKIKYNPRRSRRIIKKMSS